MNAAVNAVRPVGRVRSRRTLRILVYTKVLLLDVGSIVVGFAVADCCFPVPARMISGWGMALLVVLAFLGFAVTADLYSRQTIDNPGANRMRALTALTYAILTLLVFFFATHATQNMSRLTFVTGSAGAFLLLVVSRALADRLLLRSLRDELYNEVLIVDDVPFSGSSGRFAIHLQELGLRPDLSDPAMLHEIGLLLAGFDRAVIACSAERRDSWILLLRGGNIQGEILVEDRLGSIIGIGRFGEGMTHVVSRGPLNTTSRARKRALDLAVTVPLLMFLAPLLVLVAILIKCDSEGPVLFRQNRVGRGNQLFQILKFRSMREEHSDAAGDRSASRDDDRITRVGRFIRRTSIDELPQLLNVLKGEMSLVGPRPHALGSLAGDKLFWEVDNRYWLRHALKPGITGLAQVRGFRGATAQRVDLERRLAADLEYVQNWTLMRELKILARTFLVLVHRNAF